MRGIPEVACCERIFSDQFVFIVLAKAQRTDEEIISSYNYYAEKFLATQRGKYPACNLKFYCGIYPMKTMDVIKGIDNANMARMDAKRIKGVTAVLFSQSKLEELSVQVKLEKELMLALHENRFSFYLQPKVDLLTGQIVGAEALARRFDREGNVIYPDSFISIMEADGSIVELDLMIFEKACEYIKDRLQKGFPVVQTSINLSRLHVQNMESTARLHSIAQKYQIPPELLEFELTESILLTEFAGAKYLCDQLRNYRYQISIDDFGSGYAGINIWQELNFDRLKLDKKFLSDEAGLRARNAAIVPGLIDIAQKLNIEVICEGVERADQCRRLLKMGCHYAQGFYFSEAVSPNEFYRIYQGQHGRYSLAFCDGDSAGEVTSS